MSNFAQTLRLALDTLVLGKYTVTLSELTGTDMYYTDGQAQQCDFKLLFSEKDLVIAILYVKPDGTFFGTDVPDIKLIVSRWIHKTKENLNIASAKRN